MNFKILIYGFFFMIFAVSCSEQITDQETLTPQTAILKAASIGTYFVSPTGSNSNPGSETQPFLTLAYAASLANPGDIIIFENGVYTTTAGSTLGVLSRSGTSSAYITYKARNKWGAVLDGRNNSAFGGISIRSSYINIEGFELKGFSEFGFEVRNSVSHVNIRDIHVHDIGRMCTDDAMGIDAYYLKSSSYITVERCLINDIGRFGPGENGCTPGNEYWKNHDHGIYIDGSSYVTIKNNIFYNIRSGQSLHVYSGEGAASSNINFVNNTLNDGNLANNAGHIILWGALSSSLIANNIFKDQLSYAIQIYQGSYAYSNVSITNNITSGGNGTVSTGTANGVSIINNFNSTDPLFSNEANHDYSLKSNSPANTTGYNTLLTSDYLNNIRTSINIGALAATSSSGAQVTQVAQVVPVVPVAPVVSASLYYNTQISATATKNNCGTGYTGSTVTYTVPANKYYSSISQADANAYATIDINTNKQTYANANGTCTSTSSSSTSAITSTGPVALYYNTQISATATKNNCGTGYIGSTVTYTVPAKKYYSSISQADANAYATNDIKVNIQAYANVNGTCTGITSSTLYYSTQTSATATKNNCGTGYTGSKVTYTVPARKYYSSISQADANAYATIDINKNKQAYANANGTCTRIKKY